MHRQTSRRSSYAAIAAAVGLAAGVLAGAALPASASPAWSVSASPSPHGPQKGALNAITCATATSCVAVGDTWDPQSAISPYSTLPSPTAQHWNGADWVADPLTKPSGSGWVTFAGVACATASDCFAAGYDSSRGTLVEQWNGTTWTVVPSPDPGGSTGAYLASVACVDASNCFAVGASNVVSPSSSLIEQWNGSSWAIVASPNPAGSNTVVLSGVSCVNASNCFAVGKSSVGNVTTSLVEQWNGSSWAIVTSPNPVGATTTVLNAVSCTSATNCFAAGSSEGTRARTLVERWNGSDWSIVTSANPSGPVSASLTSVSCVSPTACVLAGASKSGSVRETLAERWNGTSAALVAGPSVGGDLSGAACIAAASCFLVGSSNGFALLEHGNGMAFIGGGLPARASQSNLRQVACAGASLCFAVGSFNDGSIVRTLIERWNGTSWAIVTSPNRSVASNVLNGVSCPAVNTCFAVGASSGDKTLIERWNGKHWSIAALPHAGTLSSVSCFSAHICVAVGASGTRTLVEQWMGNGWVAETSANRGSSSNELDGVSCPSATMCFAVGVSGSQTLIERWNGAKWSIVAAPNRSGLVAVSCVGTNNCFAAGSAIERWNGKAWSVSTSPPSFGELVGISCASVTSCVAVGTEYAVHAESHSALLRQWNGTKWSAVTLPVPAGSPSVALNGVVCRAAANCVVTGSATTSTSELTLVERYH